MADRFAASRLVAKVPHGHWKTTTLIAALDHQGMRCSMTIDGAVNTLAFEAFVDQVLVPTLSAGEWVPWMGQLSPATKVSAVRQLIESTGAKLLYLPHYSPDLNPNELAFSKLKQLLRSAGHRSIDALWSDAADAQLHHHQRRLELHATLRLSLQGRVNGSSTTVAHYVEPLCGSGTLWHELGVSFSISTRLERGR